MIRWRQRPASSPSVALPQVWQPHAAASSDADDEQHEISSSLVALSQPYSAGGAAFHRLAGEIIRQHLEPGRRGLALCGASAGTGVTFTAANLAIALAQSGIPTLLVDANFRSPGLESLIRPLVGNGGLQAVLRSELGTNDAIHHEVLPNLSLLYAGGASSHAEDLVACAGFRDVLRSCMRNYGCTLIDTPPANQSADARTIASAVGHAAIVGRQGFTFLEDAGLLSAQMAQDGVNVVGSIFNGAV